MSGGSLNYFYSDLEEHVGDFKDLELDDLVSDLAELFHDREWYLSGDTCEGKWNESRIKFKKKWFEKYSRIDRVEKYIEDTKKELLISLGLFDNYCKDCEHWTKTEDEGSCYGWCDLVDGCLMHRYETCDKFRKRNETDGHVH